MRFKGLDLNLLVALDALMTEQSVSKAADRLCLSQPAMTAALGRLREYFNDPLLVLSGKRMVPTSYALRLVKDFEGILSNIEEVIIKTTAFDHTITDRTFKIAASDFFTQVILTPLIRKLSVTSPNIKFEITPPSEFTADAISRGLIDLAVLPEQFVTSELQSELLLTEQFVVAGCAANPIFEEPLTEEIFYAQPLIVTKLGGARPQSISYIGLEERKIELRCDVVVSSFLLAPEMVVGTHRLVVMHERLARLFQQRLPIKVVSMPFKIPPLREFIQFHKTRLDDQGLKWLIHELHLLSINNSDTFI